jgi:iron complex outermembrane receptor protein
MGAVLALMLALYAVPAASAVQSDEQLVRFDVAAQPMAPALEALAREAGIEILFDRTVLGARRTMALHGRMTPAKALARLLAGSGLAARRTAGGAYVIVRPASGEEQAPAPAELVTAANRGPPRPPDPLAVAEVLIVGRRSLDADIPRNADDIQPYQISSRAEISASQAQSVEDFFRSRLPADAQSIAMVQAPVLNNASTQSRIDLHGLGSGQTLVLVDGHRMPSAPAYDDFLQPDLNGIPLAAIDRIETLTSTAGGIFGPGATGGVINVVLRRDVNGVELGAMAGATDKGDGRRWRLDAMAGGRFFDGRTRVTLALSETDDAGLAQGDRNFTEIARLNRQRSGVSTGFGPPVSNAINIVSQEGEALQLSDANGGGVLNGSHDFIPYGVEGVTAMLASLKANAGSTFDSSLSPDGHGRLASLVTRARTRSAVFSLRQEITPDFEVFVDGLYLDSFGTATGKSQFSRGVAVPEGQYGNPFAQDVYVSFPLPGASADTTNHALTTRATFGVIRRLGHGWTSEADLTIGRAAVDIRIPLVTDFEDDAGAPVFDRLGANLFSGASIKTLLSTLPTLKDDRADSVDNLSDINLRLAGPVTRLPGGALMLTLLGELRRETNPGETFESVNYGFTRVGSQEEVVGSFYGEARAPLIHRNEGGPFSGLELQLAVRGDAYDVTLPVFNEQLLIPGGGSTAVSSRHQTIAVTAGFRIFPFEGLELRGSYATGFLPPAPYQIVPARFETPQQDNAGLPPDPRRGGAALGSQSAFITDYNGSPALAPEKAVSLSAGLVFTPERINGLRLSIDYTRIDKSREIRDPSGGDEYVWLLAHEAAFPGRVTRAPLTANDIVAGYTGGVITSVDFSPLNIGRSTLDTVDFNLDYRHGTPLGMMELYAQATWTPRFERQDDPYKPAFDTVGYIDGPLEWRGDIGGRLRRGPWTFELNAQLLSSYRVSFGATDELSRLEGEANTRLQGGDKVPWQGYLDGQVMFQPQDTRLRIGLGVRNLLDARPPLVFIPLTPQILNTDVTPDEGIGYSPYGDPRGRRFELSIVKRF